MIGRTSLTRELSDSDTIRSMPCITAFDAGKRQINASKAFSKRQPCNPGSTGVIACGLPFGGRTASGDARLWGVNPKCRERRRRQSLLPSCKQSTTVRPTRQDRSIRSSSLSRMCTRRSVVAVGRNELRAHRSGSLSRISCQSSARVCFIQSVGKICKTLSIKRPKICPAASWRICVGS
jgi:hypothetical protein